MIVLTNFEKIRNNVDFNLDVKIFIYNPWGFSKKGIEDQIINLTFDIGFSNEKILFYVGDLFFGNRTKIALNKLRELFPSNEIIVIKNENELHLFLDQSSV